MVELHNSQAKGGSRNADGWLSAHWTPLKQTFFSFKHSKFGIEGTV